MGEQYEGPAGGNLMKKFRKWLIHKLGGICKDDSENELGLTVTEMEILLKDLKHIFTPRVLINPLKRGTGDPQMTNFDLVLRQPFNVNDLPSHRTLERNTVIDCALTDDEVALYKKWTKGVR